ncbi:uncharacterized protein ISCGN_004846 [Ixodes scapularis]
MEKRSRRKRKRIVLSDDSGSEEVNDFDLWPMPSPPPYACPPERHSQPTMSTHSGTPMPSRESGMSLRNSPERHSQPTMSTHSGAPIPSRGSGVSFRNSPERHSEPTMLTHSGAPIPSKGSGVSFRYSPERHSQPTMLTDSSALALSRERGVSFHESSERHYQPTMSTHSSALGLSRERGVLLHESSERHSQPTMSTHSSAPALSREHGVSLHASSERRYQPTMSAHSSAPALSREHGVLFHESSERDSQPTMSTYSSAPVLSRKHGDDYNACSIRNLLKLQARQLAFEEKVLHNHAQILSEVKQFRRMLVAHGKTSKPVRLPEDCPKIPATNISELLDIERYLEKESNMEALVHFFSKKGGNDHNDCVRAVLGDLVANEAALQLSWKGSGGTKGSFQKFEQILSLILSSVKDHDCVGTATLTSVKKVVKPWLAGAGDRRGGRNRRRKASSAPE